MKCPLVVSLIGKRPAPLPTAKLAVLSPHDLCDFQPSVINDHKVLFLCFWIKVSTLVPDASYPFFCSLSEVVLYLHIVKAIATHLLWVISKHTMDQSLNFLVPFHQSVLLAHGST